MQSEDVYCAIRLAHACLAYGGTENIDLDIACTQKLHVYRFLIHRELSFGTLLR